MSKITTFLLLFIISTILSTYKNYDRFYNNNEFFLNFSKKKILKSYNKFFKSLQMLSNRPLSPHLSIHKKILTAVFSIFHRLTGIGLSIGAILLSLWITLLALGPDFYLIFTKISSFYFFKIFLFLWTLAIFYHLFNGVRYLFWSFGKGMDLLTVYRSGYIVLILSIISTLFVWLSV